MSKSPRSCRRATYLVSASLDRPLTRRERLSLRLHLLVCRHCRRFQAQVRRLREFIASIPRDGLPVSYLKTQLSQEARDRMIAAMESAAADGGT